MQQNLEAGNSAKQLVQVLIITAIAILMVGGALIFLLNAEVVRHQSIADNKQAEVGSSEQVAKRYRITLDSYNDTVSQIKFLETSVTPISYVPTLLEQIQALAQTTHLQVMSVRPGLIATAAPPPVAAPPPAGAAAPAVGTPPPAGATTTVAPTAAVVAVKKKEPAYDTLSIDLNVSGTYSQTSAFLYDLTRFPKIIAVSSAQMHPGTVGPGENPLGSPDVKSELHLTAYVFHDDSPPAVVPGAKGLAAAPDPSAPATLAVANRGQSEKTR